MRVEIGELEERHLKKLNNRPSNPFIKKFIKMGGEEKSGSFVVKVDGKIAGVGFSGFDARTKLGELKHLYVHPNSDKKKRLN
ncbi:hypothetical protein HY993_04560 [Candidatus Micrarchaeota archaeon]|nr:hypothetical protein [Candidatus Micrarchaeota archaeon]